MGTAVYIIILVGGVAIGAYLGWQRGLLGQTGSLLGTAFGIAGVRFLLPEFAPKVAGWLQSTPDLPYPEYSVAAVGALVIYFVFYLMFLLCGLVLNRLLKTLSVQPLDSLLGVAFGGFKWLLAISVVYNAMLGLNPSGPLLTVTGQGDGNPVELVMELSPTVFDIPSPFELHHRIQLIEARKISQLQPTNNEGGEGVYLTETQSLTA